MNRRSKVLLAVGMVAAVAVLSMALLSGVAFARGLSTRGTPAGLNGGAAQGANRADGTPTPNSGPWGGWGTMMGGMMGGSWNTAPNQGQAGAANGGWSGCYGAGGMMGGAGNMMGGCNQSAAGRRADDGEP